MSRAVVRAGVGGDLLLFGWFVVVVLVFCGLFGFFFPPTLKHKLLRLLLQELLVSSEALELSPEQVCLFCTPAQGSPSLQSPC